VVFHAGEVCEGFEGGCEGFFVGLGDFGAEFEEDFFCEFLSCFFEYKVGFEVWCWCGCLPMWMTVMVVGGGFSFRMLRVF
jgi:hypothetical protein